MGSMIRYIVVLFVLLLPTVSRAADEEPGSSPASKCSNSVKDAKFTKADEDAVQCFRRARKTGFTGGEIDSLVQVVAQVVVDKATQAGWTLLRDKFLEEAKCEDAKPLFPATCKVLRNVDIHDVLAQPDALLQAAAEDLLFYLRKGLQDAFEKKPHLKPYWDVIADHLLAKQPGNDGLLTLLIEWRTGGAKSIGDRFSRDLMARIEKALTENQVCPNGKIVGASLYAIGMCAIKTQNFANIAQCDFTDELLANSCGLRGDPLLRARAIVSLAFTAMAAKGAQRVDPMVDLTFALTEATILDEELLPGKPDDPPSTSAKAWGILLLGSLHDLVRGLVDADWVRATTGAVDATVRIVQAGGPDDSYEARTKIVTLLAAVGKYAATYKNSNAAPDKVQEARAQVIKELVDRMVNRSNRSKGAVVSLGGNLGLLAGARTISGDVAPAFPVQLGLGVGLQSYGTSKCGFHAMLTALDLGQYLVINEGSLKVQTPDAAASVIIGATAGFWFISRETPFYVGPYFAATPFVKAANGNPTVEVGLATGIYVPLLDFN